MVLEMVRNFSEQLRWEIKINDRTAHSNRRTGKVEGSHARCGNVHHQRRE